MHYVISTIQLGATVNKGLLRNMLAFADAHNVEKIHLFVMPGKTKDDDVLNPTLAAHPRIELLFPDKTGMKLNSNLKLFDTGILASQINPLTGFNKKLHRDFSYILPSPKIRYMSIPNTSRHPRFLATTGALTNGNYKMHTAQGRKADLEHEYGFAYVEVKNSRLYDYHPVMAMKNGNFNYGREYYANGKVTDQQPEALVLGDIHVGDTCPKAFATSVKQIAELRPKRVIIHDLFNGHSINHHEQSNVVSKAKLWKKKLSILEDEVDQCRDFINKLAYQFPDIEFLVVESNHDLFLAHYVSQPMFLQDGHNSVFGCNLFIQAVEGKDEPILKKAMALVGKVARNVRFLSEDEEYRVKGVGLDYHGHRGMNGARGTSMSFSNNNLRLITGHEHGPKIHPNGMVVGTLTRLKLGYTKGASSWMNANGLLYQSGKYTLITIIV